MLDLYNLWLCRLPPVYKINVEAVDSPLLSQGADENRQASPIAKEVKQKLRTVDEFLAEILNGQVRQITFVV
jgi:hypothetical protein